MHFRVASISGQEEAPRVRKACKAIEEALNRQLNKEPFGSDLTQLSLTFISAFDDPEEAARWTAKNSYLSRSTKVSDSEVSRNLSIGIQLTRPEMKYLQESELIAHLARAAAEATATRPSKLPAALNYSAMAERLRIALSSLYAGAA